MRCPEWTIRRCGNLRDVQQRFQGDYVVDLAAPERTPRKWRCHYCKSHEETQPYAAWLKAQMDYLEVADEILLTIPASKSRD